MENNLETILRRALDNTAENLTSTAPRRVRFCYPIDQPTAARLLSTAYRVEVEARAMKLQTPPELSHQLAGVATYLTARDRKPSLLLYGGQPGTGKTTTVLAVIRMAKQLRESYGTAGIERLQNELQRCLTDQERTAFERRENAVKVPQYCHALEIARLAKADPAKYNTLSESCGFLAIDDLGTEPPEISDFGNKVLPLVELLLRRYDKQLPTIITTNLSEKQIADIYGARIADRLREMCERISYNRAESYRV